MTKIPGYTTSKGSGTVGPLIPTYGSTTASKYLGGMDTVAQHQEFDTTPSGGRIAVGTPGYVNGDQVKLLPNNAEDLATLQQSLIQAGYISQDQANRMVLGSPDQVTAAAFAKLLATANYSGSDWRSALAIRLTAAGQQAPVKKALEVPPLTISLSNPDDIKSTLQKSAQSLLGGYMSDDQANFFVGQFQNAQRQQQTAAYYQQYDPAKAAAGDTIYGPGGTTTAAPDMSTAAESYAKAADPLQYQATQIGAGISSALDNLRTTGYL